MFTGIVEALRPVTSIRRTGEAAVLAVDLGELAEGVSLGDSVSVNGACLTVTGVEGPVVTFDLSTETLRLTALGDLQVGTPVNVERALRVGDRLGGHFVQGHVDGIGTLLLRTRQSGGTVIRFQVPPTLTEGMILKGSVAVDGISLTITAVGDDWFEVWLIPHTLQMTTLAQKPLGAHMNIETDMIGKWVRRVLEQTGGQTSGLTAERLKDQGFC